MKYAQNHRQIDARGEDEGIKPVIYGILYFLPSSVYYFSSYLLRKVTFLQRPTGGKIYFPPWYEEKVIAIKNTIVQILNVWEATVIVTFKL